MRSVFAHGGIVLVLLGIVWLAVKIPGSAVTTRTTRTLALITQIVNDVDLWNADDVRLFGALPLNETNSLLLNRKLASLFKLSSDKAITSGKAVSSDGLFRDGWGEPLLFTVTNAVEYGRINPEMKRGPRFMAVWSAGPNRTNEYGYGDDLFSHL